MLGMEIIPNKLEIAQQFRIKKGGMNKMGINNIIGDLEDIGGEVERIKDTTIDLFKEYIGASFQDSDGSMRGDMEKEEKKFTEIGDFVREVENNPRGKDIKKVMFNAIVDTFYEMYQDEKAEIPHLTKKILENEDKRYESEWSTDNSCSRCDFYQVKTRQLAGLILNKNKKFRWQEFQGGFFDDINPDVNILDRVHSSSSGNSYTLGLGWKRFETIKQKQQKEEDERIKKSPKTKEFAAKIKDTTIDLFTKYMATSYSGDLRSMNDFGNFYVDEIKEKECFNKIKDLVQTVENNPGTKEVKKVMFNAIVSTFYDLYGPKYDFFGKVVSHKMSSEGSDKDIDFMNYGYYKPENTMGHNTRSGGGHYCTCCDKSDSIPKSLTNNFLGNKIHQLAGLILNKKESLGEFQRYQGAFFDDIKPDVILIDNFKRKRGQEFEWKTPQKERVVGLGWELYDDTII